MAQKQEQKESRFDRVLKELVLALVVLVWICTTLYGAIEEEYEIPGSVQIGFTMVLGYLLGDRAIEALKKSRR